MIYLDLYRRKKLVRTFALQTLREAKEMQAQYVKAIRHSELSNDQSARQTAKAFDIAVLRFSELHGN